MDYSYTISYKNLQRDTGYILLKKETTQVSPFVVILLNLCIAPTRESIIPKNDLLESCLKHINCMRCYLFI